jgi:hypothetical protein
MLVVEGTMYARLKAGYTRTDNKIRELSVNVLHTSLLNITAVACKVLPLGRYALMAVRSLPFKTILEPILWNGLQSCHQNALLSTFPLLWEQKKVIGG